MAVAGDIALAIPGGRTETGTWRCGGRRSGDRGGARLCAGAAAAADLAVPPLPGRAVLRRLVRPLSRHRRERRRLVRQLPLRASTVGGRPIPAFQSGDSTRRSDAGRTATTAVGGVFGRLQLADGALPLRDRGRPLRRQPQAPGPLECGRSRLRGRRSGLQRDPGQRPTSTVRCGPASAIRSRAIWSTPPSGSRVPMRGCSHLSRPRERRGGHRAQGPVVPRLHPRAGCNTPSPRPRPSRSASTTATSISAAPAGSISAACRASVRSRPSRLLVAPDDGAALLVPLRPQAAAEVAEDAPASRDTGRYSFHGQTTFITQGVPGFPRAPIAARTAWCRTRSSPPPPRPCSSA